MCHCSQTNTCRSVQEFVSPSCPRARLEPPHCIHHCRASHNVIAVPVQCASAPGGTRAHHRSRRTRTSRSCRPKCASGACQCGADGSRRCSTAGETLSPLSSPPASGGRCAISRRSAGGCALYTRPPLNSNETAQVHMQGAPPGMEAMLQNPDMMRNMSSMMANLTPEDMQRMSSMAGAFGGGGGAPGARRSKSQWLTSGNRAGTMLWLRRSGARFPHGNDCTELNMVSDGVRDQARAGCRRCRRT